MSKILFAILTTFTLSSQAQKAPIFIEADFGLSNIKTSSGKTTMNIGFGIGVETFAKLSKSLAINPALAFRKTGYDNSGDKVQVNYLALDLPLVFNAGALFNDTKYEDVGVIFGAGPYAAYAISGDFTISGVKKTMSFGNSTADNRKSIDAGLVFKSGIRLKKIFIGSQYNIGVINLIPKDRITNGSSIKSRNFLFYLSVPLTGWKK